MGDHEGWAQPSSVPLNGLLANEVGGVTRILDADRWSVAEARTAELIERIQPNRRSEERRNAVASYVQRLIMKCFSCQVFTFGSVPLKTYLPDGDIDMTAFSKNLNLKDTWANDVRDMLENEEKSENAEFHVKEVQYIQAEVKIIKCLVENIVVDISFNQLGGLCTLCFLEEIDQVIDQDHLFKRSIILIKAWCYYESRILGAHHGLISTYALEILVLYIFHMFNNSFAGPLEVLYRFLEFFSNFDWDDFCVSLWGPVLISSLPDMTAEPPRKDNGKLLLSKQYLDDCSTKYSVFPGGQENQGQPFVSKFFNVIDPLRTNNNLGRSVSKGNFYRIRSAFAFGAKRLAGLLECPKDNLIAEVNKFFMNTWRQHGSGHRPDAPSPKLQNMQPLSNTGSVDFPENFRNHAIHKMMVEDGPLAGHGDDDDQTVSPQGVPSHSISFANQPTHNRTGNLSATSAQIQRNYINQNNSRVTDRFERTLSSSGHVPSDGGQQASRPDYLENGYQGQGSGRFQFARTRSSPELSDTSADVSSRRRTKMQETVKSQVPSARPEHSSRRKNLGSEMVGSRSGKSSANDPSSVRHGSSKQNFDVTDDSNCSSNSYHEDSGFVATNEEFTSFPEVSGMHQEEQDLVNMIAASSVGNFNGQVQLPMNTPAHLPFPSSSSVLASMGYLQQNLTGIHSESIPLIKPHWGSVVQFPHDLDSTQMANYYPNAGLASNPEEFIESGNESSGITEAEPEDVDHGFWPDQDNGSIRMSVTGERNVQMLHSDDRNVSSTGGFNSSSSRVSNSGSYTRGQRKLVRDNRGLAREDFSDTLNYQNNRGQDTYTSDRNLSLRFMASTPTSPSRSKSSSESSWDGSSTKLSRLARDKHGRKATSTTLPSPYGKSKSGRQYEESSSDHVSISAEDDNKEWIPLSTMGTDVVERSTGSGSLGPMDSQVHQSSGYESTPDYESTQTSSSDSMVPVAPVLVSASSRPRTGDNAGMMPFAFYATGPPVPYLTMLPVYPYNSGNSNGTTSQLDNGRLENGHTNPSDQNFESTEDLEQTDLHISTGSMEGTSFEHSEEHKPDILNSDLASHWKHLQFGRLCQNTRPMMYPSPVVTPMYLQGHFPWDGPGRPLLANMNLLTQFMNYPQFVPVAQLPPGQSRPSGMYRRYGDEVPRYRGGTGTYLPNPKVSSRDRQASNARNHRGNYGHERRDHGDREGSWINSKSRAAGRTHGRNQTEKPGSRSEWLSTADNRPEKPWNSYRRDPLASYQNQNSSFSSTSIHGSANMAYSMYPLPAVNSNGMSAVGPTVPSVMMLYSYDPGASHASSSEQLEFGSLGPVHFSPTGEVAQDMDGGPVRDTFDQKQGAYQQGSTHSSPDQPSSPQIHQRAV